jgi:hypothetical protein
MENNIIIEGYGATDGRVEDVNSYRAEICGIATFAIFTLISKIYGFSPPTIEHVCDNQSAITATWQDENIGVFDKTKPDVGVSNQRKTPSRLPPLSVTTNLCLVMQDHKVTSPPPPYHISNAIHGPKLTEYLTSKEIWTTAVFQSTTWDSFQIAFNKLTTARQIVTTKMIYSFCCTNSRHRRNRGQMK